MTWAGRYSLAPRPSAPRRGDSIVPMINIVFLLLIFFMLTATIAPPDPFDLALPEGEVNATAPAAPRRLVLVIGADGARAHDGATGAAALAALRAAYRPGDLVELRADAGLDGAAFARLLAELAAAGIDGVTLALRQAPHEAPHGGAP